MTHPTTEPTHSVQERLARLMAAQYHRAAYRGRDGEKEYCDETWESFLEDLDAILAELQKPSEGMQKAGIAALCERDNVAPAMPFIAMIQYIRDGGL